MKQIQCVIPGLVQKLRSFLFSAKLVSISKFSQALEVNQNTGFHSFTYTCYKQRDHQIKTHTIVMLREDCSPFPFIPIDEEQRRGKEELILKCSYITDPAILMGQALRLVKIYKDKKISIFNASVGINTSTDIRQQWENLRRLLMGMYLNFQEGEGKEPKLGLSWTRYDPRNITVG